MSSNKSFAMWMAAYQRCLFEGRPFCLLVRDTRPRQGELFGGVK